MHEVTELLRQIAEQTKPDNKAIWVAAISSVSALVGAGIGALLLYRGTKKQIESASEIEEKKIRANIITTERLRWLQELRAKSSEFYANLDMHYNLLKRPVNPQANPEYQEEADKISKEVMVQVNQIILLLNPKKTHQEKMRQSCNGSLAFFQECVGKRNQGDFSFDDQKYAQIKTDYFNALTEVGVETWKQVKELK
ncbi:hypothetical protein ACQ661_10910 [Pseudidiomarina sp. WS423]|uniref:hypothetical protein n=1 Tax=Pseudidiomarina sp. WS423 TaxID=3425124 RepID=UPI003D6EB73A